MEKDTKSHIIDIGVKLFQDKGMNKVSLNEVVKASNLSKGAFYHHFKNKDELIIACVKAFWSDMAKQFLDIPFQEMSLKEVMDMLLEQYKYLLQSFEEENNNTFEFYMNILFYIKNDEELLIMSKTYFQQYTDIFSHCIQKDQNKGLIKKEIDAVKLSRHLITTSEGFALMAFSKIYDQPMEVIEDIYQQVYNSIKI
ncbi:TetR/AcrR family transcriptional regulator [Flammeovirga pacifica]|uniref:HTH tetR-type domain-containing protein n=1 Tax=Flammeovirga pacifica TaxID=915059 RepID=A0A1S1Z467_FLAPC|nr:TetR/AcrR family transcriptional regulator [Flammeovirga pacifica]OHX68022.1 hypothetical protein NH26_17565 [Flammeovirga pacifica]